MYLTPEQFEEQLKIKFDNLTADEFNNLCVTTNNNLKSKENNFILEVLKSVWKVKQISFKQWKALNSFNSEVEKSRNKKSFQ